MGIAKICGVTAANVAAVSAVAAASIAAINGVAFSGGGGGGDPNFADVTALLHLDGSNGSSTMTDSSSSAHTFTAGGADASYASVTLLLKLNGSNGSTTITDNSPSPLTLTVNGNAQLATAQKRFGPSSLLLDGTGDYLSHAANDAFRFPGDFTVEFWVNPSTTGTAVLYDGRTAGNSSNGFAIYKTSGSLAFFTANADRITQASGLGTGAWIHIAICRSGSTIRMFRDGGQVGSNYTNSANFSDGQFKFGADAAGSNGLNGYIDDVRITKGVARYTATFNPGCHGDNTNAVLSTAEKKYGTAALYLDTFGHYISAPSHADFQFAGDFTVEFWMYGLSSPSIDHLIDFRTTVAAITGFALRRAAGVLQIFQNNAAWASIGGAVSDNAWHHIAMSRTGTTVRLFIDGVQAGSTAAAGQNFSDGQCFIGGEFNSLRGSFNGYIDDLRITNGVCRYTAGFTPPAAAFPDS